MSEYAILPDINKIAVLRPNATGDFAFSLPCLHALKAAYPSAKNKERFDLQPLQQGRAAILHSHGSPSASSVWKPDDRFEACNARWVRPYDKSERKAERLNDGFFRRC